MSLKRKGIELAKRIAGTHFTDASDEFLNWMFVSNAGMQHKGNIACFSHAIENLPGTQPLLEIGAHAGLSANVMCYLLRKFRKPNSVISVDPWTIRGYRDGNPDADEYYLKNVGGQKEFSREAFADFILESYLRNTEFFSGDNLPFAVRTTSDDFFNVWSNQSALNDIRGREMEAGGEISFAYIDGNHDYEFARRDFENADKLLAQNGFILFDDSEDHSPFGSAVLAKEIENNNRYRLVMKNPNRLFQKLR